MLYKKLSIAILALITFSCAEDIAAPDGDPHQFFYNTATGKCENYRGEQGYNKFDLEKARTKDCECMDLSHQQLFALDTSHVFSCLSWSLDNFNFRGARLDSAWFFSGTILNADLRGADISTFQYNFSSVTGYVDQFTRLPYKVQSNCDIVDNFLTCGR